MKLHPCIALSLSLLVLSCEPQNIPQNAPTPPAVSGGDVIKNITEVSHIKNGMSEVKKITVDGKAVIISMQWRAYSLAQDAAVTTWYGDMSRPPAKYVVNSFTVSVDGKNVNIPQSKYRYLASQWMNEIKKIGVFKQGKDLNVYVDLGDGSEAWTASYVINPAGAVLVFHEVHDGVDFHNNVLR